MSLPFFKVRSTPPGTPVVLGGGTPMFKPSEERLRLKLLEARPMQSGAVLLRYGLPKDGEEGQGHMR